VRIASVLCQCSYSWDDNPLPAMKLWMLLDSAKYRSLLANLRDAKNDSLRHRIYAGLLSPETVVRLSAEELANEELSRKREEERRRLLNEAVVRPDDLAGIRIVNTDIRVSDSYRDAEPASSSQPLVALQPTEPAPVRPALPRTDEPERRSASPLPEAKLSSPTVAKPSPPASEDSAARTDMSATAQSSLSPAPREAHRPTPERRSPSHGRTEESSSSDAATQPSGQHAAFRIGSGQSPREVVWHGTIVMPQVATIRVTAHCMDGRPPPPEDGWPGLLGGGEPVLAELIGQASAGKPGTQMGLLHVHGRVDRTVAEDYLSKIAQSHSKEIRVLRLAPPHVDDEPAFVQLTEYLRSRARYAVLAGDRAARNPLNAVVKDCYLVPVEEHALPPYVSRSRFTHLSHYLDARSANHADVPSVEGTALAMVIVRSRPSSSDARARPEAKRRRTEAAAEDGHDTREASPYDSPTEDTYSAIFGQDNVPLPPSAAAPSVTEVEPPHIVAESHVISGPSRHSPSPGANYPAAASPPVPHAWPPPPPVSGHFRPPAPAGGHPIAAPLAAGPPLLSFGAGGPSPPGPPPAPAPVPATYNGWAAAPPPPRPAFLAGPLYGGPPLPMPPPAHAPWQYPPPGAPTYRRPPPH